MSSIEGGTGAWEVVIGLETHAQVISNAKLFSGAATAFGAEPNTQVSLVDAAFPGMLPVINKHCVEQAVKTGLGLGAQINLVSVFDRKNYFYADLPAGYQISQYTRPVVGKGKLSIDLADGTTRDIGITRLHLEQDAGKSLHDQHATQTYVDLNRAGVALMEIVSEPDLRSAEEAGAYVKKLRSILRYLGTCDGNMEEGSLRCDCNVSVRKPGAPYGTRCEIKNVNSIRFVMQAIEYEARRQIEVIEEGGTIRQETRLFDSARGVTRPMRSKEEAHDYRYFPDPDLLPLELDAAWVDGLKRGLPELPDAKKARFVKLYGLSPEDASVIVAEKEAADYFESVVSEALARGPQGETLVGIARIGASKLASGRDVSATIGNVLRECDLVINTGDQTLLVEVKNVGKRANTVVAQQIFSYLNKPGASLSDAKISPRNTASLITLQADGTISGRIAKDIFDEMIATGKNPAAIVEAKGLRQVTDSGEIEAAVDAVLAKEPDKIAEYRGGKDKLLGFFVGQVMKATGGKANPGLVNELLKKKLTG